MKITSEMKCLRNAVLTTIRVYQETKSNKNRKQPGSTYQETLGRRLADRGIMARKPRMKPYSSEVNGKKRLKLTTEHQNWTLED